MGVFPLGGGSLECLESMAELEDLGVLRGEFLGEFAVLTDDFVVTSFFIGGVGVVVVADVVVVVAAVVNLVVGVGCESGSWCGGRGGSVRGFGRGS